MTKCIKCKEKRANFNKHGETTALYCASCKGPDMIDIKSKKCIICKKKQPNFNKQGEIEALYCATCKESNMIDVKNKKCITCKMKRPNFNKQGQNEALYCSICKDPDMIDVNHKKCIICKKKRPFYNKQGEIEALYCTICKEYDMINITSKKCIICKKKQPTFNKQEELEALYCSICKQSDMIDVKHKKCIICKKKHPNFNKQGELVALYCATCKESDMIDVKSKKCIICKKKYPNFNKQGEIEALYCSTCKEPDMIDVKHKKCKSEFCTKRATFSLPGVIPEYCLFHRLDGMIKNPRKKCTIKNCKEIATYGITKSEHCESHLLSDEYNLAERICPQCSKIDILNKDGVCINSCSLLEIDNAVKKHKKKHEEYIGKIINKNIDTSKILFTWNDKVIDTSCTKQRPDFVFHCGSHVVIVEVDEDQHKSYKSCGNTKEEIFKTELSRMYNIGNIFIGLPVIFIRFNPDNYKDINGNKITISVNKRHEILIKWINKCIDNDVSLSSSYNSKIKVKYLFYDGYEESDSCFIHIKEEDLFN